jgi:hypothetical protein
MGWLASIGIGDSISRHRRFICGALAEDGAARLRPRLIAVNSVGYGSTFGSDLHELDALDPDRGRLGLHGNVDDVREWLQVRDFHHISIPGGSERSGNDGRRPQRDDRESSCY